MRLIKIALRIVIGLVILGGVAMAGLLALMGSRHASPVTLPTPVGPYAVGRVEYDWVDQSRAETFGPGAGGKRELDVWVWYPAGTSTTQIAAPYLPGAWLTARSSGEQPAILADFLTQDPAVVHSHAIAGAPLASGPAAYPVLVLQPGLGPILADYTTLAEDLASRGYVVVGSTPTYSAAAAAFPDGRVVAGIAAANVPDDATPAQARQILDGLIRVWAADDSFVLTQTVALNQADPEGRFTGHLDLGQVGFWGHSFGGAAAAETCHLDARCRAGLNLDGYPYGDVIQTGLDQPFMSIWSEPFSPTDPDWLQATAQMRQMESRLGADGYQLMIRGSRHFNFTDNSVFYAPFLAASGRLGAIDGRRFLAISTTYIAAFFDHTLKGQAEPLLAGPSAAYPEVVFLPR